MTEKWALAAAGDECTSLNEAGESLVAQPYSSRLTYAYTQIYLDSLIFAVNRTVLTLEPSIIAPYRVAEANLAAAGSLLPRCS